MSLERKTFAVVRGASVLVLAVLLLLTPICGAICQAQMCDAQQTGAEKPACHESSGVTADPSNSHISAIRNCSLQQIPVALPASFRLASGDSLFFAKTERNASPLAILGIVLPVEMHFPCLCSPSGESRSLSGFVGLSSLVLRI
jgi:hypothetical protein